MIRRSLERGYFDHGWLQSHHSFSFAGYFDPKWLGFRSLLVINEDTVQPNAGFPTHPHKDMEILTYVFSGTLAHRDSMGNVATIEAGEFQVMSAGTGITHSEYNPSSTEPVRLMQIWIKPNALGIQPRYGQKQLGLAELKGDLKLIASPDARDGSFKLYQDACVSTGILPAGKAWSRALDPQRYYWLQVVSGELETNHGRLNSGDGLAIEASTALEITPTSEANLILFDLA